MEAALFSGMLVGNISSSFILRMTNAFTVFVVSTGSSMLAVLYIAFSVKESVIISEEDRNVPYCSKLGYLFRPRTVLETFKTCFSWRSNYGRAVILIGILVLGGDVFAVDAANIVFFLYLRKQFNWAVREYSFYSSTEKVMQVLGNLLATYVLERLLGLSVAGIASIGFFSFMVNSIVIAVASEPWQLYSGKPFLKFLSKFYSWIYFPTQLFRSACLKVSLLR